MITISHLLLLLLQFYKKSDACKFAKLSLTLKFAEAAASRKEQKPGAKMETELEIGNDLEPRFGSAERRQNKEEE